MSEEKQTPEAEKLAAEKAAADAAAAGIGNIAAVAGEIQAAYAYAQSHGLPSDALAAALNTIAQFSGQANSAQAVKAISAAVAAAQPEENKAKEEEARNFQKTVGDVMSLFVLSPDSNSAQKDFSLSEYALTGLRSIGLPSTMFGEVTKIASVAMKTMGEYAQAVTSGFESLGQMVAQATPATGMSKARGTSVV